MSFDPHQLELVTVIVTRGTGDRLYVMNQPSWDLPVLHPSRGEGTFKEKEGGNVAVATGFVSDFCFFCFVGALGQLCLPIDGHQHFERTR